MVDDPRQGHAQGRRRPHDGEHLPCAVGGRPGRVRQRQAHGVVVHELAGPGGEPQDQEAPHGDAQVLHHQHDVGAPHPHRHHGAGEEQRQADPHDPQRDLHLVLHRRPGVAGVVGRDDPLGRVHPDDDAHPLQEGERALGVPGGQPLQPAPLQGEVDAGDDEQQPGGHGEVVRPLHALVTQDRGHGEDDAGRRRDQPPRQPLGLVVDAQHGGDGVAGHRRLHRPPAHREQRQQRPHHQAGLLHAEGASGQEGGGEAGGRPHVALQRVARPLDGQGHGQDRQDGGQAEVVGQGRPGHEDRDGELQPPEDEGRDPPGDPLVGRDRREDVARDDAAPGPARRPVAGSSRHGRGQLLRSRVASSSTWPSSSSTTP